MRWEEKALHSRPQFSPLCALKDVSDGPGLAPGGLQPLPVTELCDPSREATNHPRPPAPTTHTHTLKFITLIIDFLNGRL